MGPFEVITPDYLVVINFSKILVWFVFLAILLSFCPVTAFCLFLTSSGFYYLCCVYLSTILGVRIQKAGFLSAWRLLAGAIANMLFVPDTKSTRACVA
ncbi:hypothetical protein BDR07DRAFT_1423981 [Suillus spraguei]|nr:hypothetical protein BDR07DRAFT_1423981 [Suillus spraguei]